MALTDKQKRFVEEYLIDLNATQAAIRAGYSEKTARAIACENLTKLDVQNAISESMKTRSERTKVTQDRVIEELARIAFLDIREAFNDDGNLLPINKMPEHVARAIGGMDIDNVRSIGDDETSQTRKVKILDKRGALELLGKHLAMFTERVEHAGEVTHYAVSSDPLPKDTKEWMDSLKSSGDHSQGRKPH